MAKYEAYCVKCREKREFEGRPGHLPRVRHEGHADPGQGVLAEPGSRVPTPGRRPSSAGA